MAEKIVSPGVFTRENDLSFLAQGIGEIGAAVIGPFQKGPAFVPDKVILLLLHSIRRAYKLRSVATWRWRLFIHDLISPHCSGFPSGTEFSFADSR